MKKTKTLKILLSFILLFLFSNFLFAQINANFTVDSEIGCNHLIVRFTDISTPSENIVFRKWYFGNGNSSSLSSPQASYGEAGSYTVTLIVSNGVFFDTIVKTDFIQVLKDPIPNFTTLTSNLGCSPLPVSFQDLSIGSNGSAIKYWDWDFGDGVISHVQTPTHVYERFGDFSVSLHVIDENACENSIQFDSYINILETPVPQFTTSKRIGCSKPFEIDFFNNTTKQGTLTYLWNFGDGTTSTVENPTHIYDTLGRFSPYLIASNENNCSDTLILEEYIKLGPVIADFETSDSVFCVSDSFLITNISKGANSYLWDFGDGNTSHNENPSHFYDKAGVYTISLTSSYIEGDTCSNKIQKIIRIEDVVAKYTRDPFYICQLPQEVHYTNTSINAVSWEWHLEYQNLRYNNQNLLINYDSISTKTKTFKDTLIAVSQYGCIDTLIQDTSIYISIPDIYILTQYSSKCVPSEIAFVDSINYNSSFDSIVSWHWDFGNGDYSLFKNPIYTFNQPGDYITQLTTETAEGCVNKKNDTVSVGNIVFPDFKVSPFKACASDVFNFTDLTTDENLVNSWIWSFNFYVDPIGANYLDSIKGGNVSRKQNPKIIFLDTGYVSCTLKSAYNGCVNKIVKDSVAYVNGVVGYFHSYSTCENPLSYLFKGSIINADRWYWNFGDGSAIDSTSINPVHDYLNPGRYFVKLTSYNDEINCFFVDTHYVDAVKASADILADNVVGCKGLEVKFDGGVLTENHTKFWLNKEHYTYLWNFGNDNLFNDKPYLFTNDSLVSYTFNNKGVHKVSLVVEDINKCRDTAFQFIKIYIPEVEFTSNDTNGCAPMNIEFINNTKTDTTMILWNWNFGDGTMSNFITPTHIYDADTSFNVSLYAKNILGCTDSVSHPNFIVVKKTEPKFYVIDSVICQNDTAYFINETIGYGLKYLWNFGDGSISTETIPQHFYQNGGFFDVSLTVTDTFKCISVLSFDSLIHKQVFTKVDFVADSVYTACYPLVVNFDNYSNYEYITSWQWSFGDGASSVLQHPKHMYVRPGNFAVELIASTKNGCISNIIKSNYIDVDGPYAVYSAPDFICKDEEVLFVIDSIIDAVSFEWDFGDGNIVASTGDTIKYTYNEYGKVFPRLLFYSDLFGACPQSYYDSIVINIINANFNFDSGVLCSQNDISFKNASFGDEYWSWNFGDGNFSKEQNPKHQFMEDGNYSVQLIVSDFVSCQDTIEKDITIKLSPSTDDSFIDTLKCDGASILLDAGGGYNGYLWSTNEITQTIEYSDSGTLTHKVKNIEGCWSSPDTIVINEIPLAVADLGIDKVICDGDSITFDVTGSIYDNYLWQNNSSSSKFVADTLGTYFVKVYNVCGEAFDTIEVSMIYLPTIDLGNDTTICENEILFLELESGYTEYLWNDKDTGFTYMVQSEGEIFATVKNEYGCWSKKDTIIVSFDKYLDINLGNDFSFCEGDRVFLSVNEDNVTFLWQDTSTNDSLFIFSEGEYSVAVSNHCGTFKDSVNIEQINLPKVDLGNDYTFFEGGDEIRILDAGINETYLWSTGDTTQYIEIFAGSYDVWVMVSSNGCYNSDTILISTSSHPENSSCIADIPTAFSPNGDGLNDILLVRGYCIKEVVFMVFNRYGEMLFNSTELENGWDGKYRGVLQPTDVYVYYLKVIFEDKSSFEKTSNFTIIE